MFEIKIYTHTDKNEWDRFVDSSKNGTFLFKRDYMEYHADRFYDFSLLIYRKNKLYALLPANRVEDTLYSHQGLTYGGIITSSKSGTFEILEIFNHLSSFLKSHNINKVVYKPVPYIYHSIPSQEDLYALFRINASLIARNISSTIYQKDKLKFIESRKSGVRKALNNKIEIHESDDFSSFWKILDDNLTNKYGTKPVHTLSEIEYLHSRFPDNIKLYLAFSYEQVLGGTVLYLTKNVLHTQYISASILGKESGALDLLFDELINKIFVDIPVFDFGQSTEQMGNLLNESLIFQKEGFGGRGVVYDIYKYTL